jgi:hypothetical protein
MKSDLKMHLVGVRKSEVKKWIVKELGEYLRMKYPDEWDNSL